MEEEEVAREILGLQIKPERAELGPNGSEVAKFALGFSSPHEG
jgi:hypothetical protein